MSVDKERFEKDMDTAIREVCARHEGAFVFKWVMLVETQAEGEQRGIWTFTAEDQMAWDSLGMLEYAAQMEKSLLTSWYLRNPDE